nr:MATE family Na+-driven efflux transporter [Methanococcoides methylutens]
MTGLIPTVYTTVRIFFLGNLPNDWGINIASQLMWVNLLYEILQESLILPLYFILGKAISNTNEFTNRLKGSMIVVFSIYTALSVLISIFAEPMVVAMAQTPELVNATVSYIRLETIAYIFLTMWKFIMLILLLIGRDKLIYIVLAVQMILTMLLDTLFISELDFSLNLGVNGIAITNIIVNIILLAVFLILLKNNENIDIFQKSRISFSWLKQWKVIAGYSGLETLVRNIAFMFMVVRMVNIISEPGTFWVTNSFIWGWLLLPVLQLSELIKSDCSKSEENITRNFRGYMGITTIIIAAWLVTIPLWEPFIKNVMNMGNYEVVFHLVLISLPFYIIFAYNNLIDSIFYGIGKTEYMLFQSVLVNTIFYGALFILFQMGIYKPTLELITLMFAAGIAADSILTFVMYGYLSKKGKIVHKYGLEGSRVTN